MFAKNVNKEVYLANYRRRYITNCMDSQTTSPVKSQNSNIHQHLGIWSNLDVHKGIECIVDYNECRISTLQNESIAKLNKTNMASCTPTKDHIIEWSQRIADTNFDLSKYYHIAQFLDDMWWCWNFTHNRDQDEEKFHGIRYLNFIM